MNKDLIFDSFLRHQKKVAAAMAAESDLFDIGALPGPRPDRFLARFRCRGLARDGSGAIQSHDQWVVGITFPDQYLRRPFEVPHILTYLGTSPAPWHPNLRGRFICLRLEVAMPMREILYALFDLLSWKLYATHDPLNEEAAQWARRQPAGTFPTDPRPLKWKFPTAAPAPKDQGGEG